MCYGQHGEIVGDFPITGGGRQGCVLSPGLFCAVLELAMRKWRNAVGQAGIDLMDGGPNLLDLRFADDILIFARSRHGIGTFDRFILAQAVSAQAVSALGGRVVFFVR